MEESDLRKKRKWLLSFTVWTGYDEMIKIEESEDAQDCFEFQRSKRSIEIQNKKFLPDWRTHYMMNAFSRSNLKGWWNYKTEKTFSL